MSKPILAVTLSSFGYLSPEEQLAAIKQNSKCAPGTVLEELRLDRDREWDISDVVELLNSTNAKTLAVWTLLALAPVVYDAEELLVFLSELERRSIDLIVVKTGEAISTRNGVSISKIKNIWFEFRLERKRENALASRAKALMRGIEVKRKTRSDPAYFLQLKREGKSAREIANIAGMSIASVNLALRRIGRDSEKNGKLQQN